jgi:hypothetical protein
MPLLSKETKRKIQDFGEGIVSPFRSREAASEVRSAIEAERAREDRADAAKKDEKRDAARDKKAYAKGGSVRGYGAARGAKKCKMY